MQAEVQLSMDKCDSFKVVPRTSVEQKKYSREIAKAHLYGKPKLKEILRNKFRQHVRKARQSSFEKLRNLDIDKILRKDLEELEHDIKLQDVIFKELIDDFNEWYINQIEKEQLYLIDTIESDDLFCPICQKCFLESQDEEVKKTDKQDYYCKCQARFAFTGDKAHLRSSIKSKVKEHEQRCMEGLSFFTEPKLEDGNVLYALCEKCDYLCSF